MNNNNDEKLNIEIRKFLKQVGVTTHQTIEDKLKNNDASFKVCIKLEIDSHEVKVFNLTLNK